MNEKLIDLHNQLDVCYLNAPLSDMVCYLCSLWPRERGSNCAGRKSLVEVSSRDRSD